MKLTEDQINDRKKILDEMESEEREFDNELFLDTIIELRESGYDMTDHIDV